MRPGLVPLIALLLSGCASHPVGEDPIGKELKAKAEPVLAALVRYHKDRGDYPRSLYELVPRYLHEVPFVVNLNLEFEKRMVEFVYTPTWPQSSRVACAAPLGALEWSCQSLR